MSFNPLIESVSSVQRRILLLEKDFTNQISLHRGTLEKAEAENNSGQIKISQDNIVRVETVYAKVIAEAKQQLAISQENENQNPNSPEKIAARKEQEKKDKALTGWIKAGGDPREFEAKWPEIKSLVAASSAVDALTNSDRNMNQPGIRL